MNSSERLFLILSESYKKRKNEKEPLCFLTFVALKPCEGQISDMKHAFKHILSTTSVSLISRTLATLFNVCVLVNAISRIMRDFISNRPKLVSFGNLLIEIPGNPPPLHILYYF